MSTFADYTLGTLIVLAHLVLAALRDRPEQPEPRNDRLLTSGD